MTGATELLNYASISALRTKINIIIVLNEVNECNVIFGNKVV